jgi:hypothetical protein
VKTTTVNAIFILVTNTVIARTGAVRCRDGRHLNVRGERECNRVTKSKEVETKLVNLSREQVARLREGIGDREHNWFTETGSSALGQGVPAKARRQVVARRVDLHAIEVDSSAIIVQHAQGSSCITVAVEGEGEVKRRSKVVGPVQVVSPGRKERRHVRGGLGVAKDRETLRPVCAVLNK